MMCICAILECVSNLVYYTQTVTKHSSYVGAQPIREWMHANNMIAQQQPFAGYNPMPLYLSDWLVAMPPSPKSARQPAGTTSALCCPGWMKMVQPHLHF